MLQLNPVKERLLFLSPVVQAGWEKEAELSDFDKMSDLGQGAFGLVMKMRHKKSHVIYAVKQMEKIRLKLSGMIDQIKTEIKIMYSLSHENIVKLFNHFEDDNHIYLVIDYAPGGQLWDKLQKTPGKRLSEKDVASFVKDLVSSLEYLHGKGIIHRDIKPENLLIDGSGHLKLADFGWSNYFKSDAQRTTFCGTLDYLAPEMLERGHQHDHMVDIWAIGVLIFELLTGKSPFSPANPSLKMKEVEKGTQQNIIDVRFEFSKEFPALAKDLVSKILRKNPRTRLNLSEIKSHPWVKCNIVVKKKELDPQALIDAVTFGQNMADQKKFALYDGQNFGINPVFTEEEIIQYARPDSMLDRAQAALATANKTMNLDKQLAEFRQQMGLINGSNIIGTTNTSNINNISNINNYSNIGTTTNNTNPVIKMEPSSIPLTSVIDSGYTPSSLSTISEESSPTKGKDLEYRLRIKTDECVLLQQEVDRLKKAAQDPYSADKIRALENENMKLRNEVNELNKKTNEKDIKLQSAEKIQRNLEDQIKQTATQSNNDSLKARIFQLEDQITRDKQYYEAKTSELQLKLAQPSANTYSPGGLQDKVKEIEEINENLNSQISEYNKLINRLYEGAAYDSDTEKKRMLEDIKTLRSLSSIKQSRIERLEAKMKSGS